MNKGKDTDLRGYNEGYQPSVETRGYKPSTGFGYNPNKEKNEKTPTKYVPPTKR